MIQINNRQTVELSNREITSEGFMKVNANVARSGILNYCVFDFPTEALPNELKNAPMDQAIRVLYRPEAVFDKESIASIIDKPVTNGHPSENVTSQNARFFSRGFVKAARKKGSMVSADLLITDSELINQINDKVKEECSTGMKAEVIWNKGEDPDFGEYDAEFKDIRVNHVAIVFKGRAGEKVRLANEESQNNKKGNGKMEKRTVNGIEIEFSNQALQAFDSVTTENEKLSGELDSVKTELENSKKELDKTKGELDATKAELANTDRIDALVKERTELITNAKVLDPKIEVDNKSNVEIKKAAILAANKDADLKDKSNDYIDAVFDTMLANAKKGLDDSNDALNGAFNNAPKGKEKPSEAARKKFVENSRNAYKSESK